MSNEPDYVKQTRKKVAEEKKKKEEQEQGKVAEELVAPVENVPNIGDALKELSTKFATKQDNAAPRTAPDKVVAKPLTRTDIADVKAGSADSIEAVLAKRGDVRNVGASIDKADQNQSRQTQQTLANQLLAQTQGKAPSIAELQAKRAGDRALAQQLALAAGATGSGAVMARRQAAQNQAQIGADIAATSAQARLAEQLQAQQQLGQVSGQMRGQDIQLSTAETQAKLQADMANQGVDLNLVKANAAAGNQAAQANLQALTQAADRDLKAQLANQGVDLDILKSNAVRGDQAAIANMQAELTKLGLDDQMQQVYIQGELATTKAREEMLFKLDELARSGAIQGEQLAIAREQVRNAKTAAEISAYSGLLGTVTSMFVPKPSDINVKKNITISEDRLTDFLDKLNAYDYDYKDQKHGEGTQTSVMAQDLEKSEIGQKAIVETDGIKMVDYGKLLPEILAATAQTHKRIVTLEEALLKRKK